MTLLTIIKDVCAVVGVQQPTSVFSSLSSNRTMQEMVALANEMARRIAYDSGKDWGTLKLLATLTGNGVKEAFDFPSNYKRMLLTSELWRSGQSLQPMLYIPDTNDWIRRRSDAWYSAWGEWTVYGGQIHIAPIMATGTSATFGYLSKNCIALASGGYGDTFLTDNDAFALDERTLKLGMVWQWKANKGSPYAEDLANYNDALGQSMGSEKPAPILVGRYPISSAVKTAYPWPVPT